MPHKKNQQNPAVKYPWWYGGAGGVFACIITHPLDLAKVRLQTISLPKPSLFFMMQRILKTEGITGLYSGCGWALSQSSNNKSGKNYDVKDTEVVCKKHDYCLTLTYFKHSLDHS